MTPEKQRDSNVAIRLAFDNKRRPWSACAKVTEKTDFSRAVLLVTNIHLV